MAITINIVKKSASYTGMRIFRSITKENVYGGAAIADLAIADSYVDNTAEPGQVYFYGVELYNAVDKTQFSPIRAINIQDYGPLTTTVQGNIQFSGKPYRHGSASFGTLTYANTAKLATIPAVSNMKAKLEELTASTFGVTTQLSSDMSMHVCIMDGKIVNIPTSPNLVLTGTSDNAANSQVGSFRAYLINNPNKAYIDIAGYRWNIKVMTREVLEKYPEIMAKNSPGTVRPTPQLIDLLNIFVWSEAEARGNLVSSNQLVSGGTFTYSSATTNGAARYSVVYYEYAGAVP